MTSTPTDWNRVLVDVLARPAVDGVRLVGVDGPSGSGKSTAAAALAAVAGAPVVEIDDFLSWQSLDAWWPRLEQQLLEPLFAGRDARYQVRDWQGDFEGSSLGGWKDLPWSPLVVLEGCGSTRAAVADRLAYAIWVEAPREERLRRGVERGGEGHRHLWERWQPMEEAWFAADGTRDRADLVVDTNDTQP
ncbi:hypothetical protein GCM10027446_30260 [Angustibacter peucedani]